MHRLGRDSSGKYQELSGDARQLKNVIQDLEDIVREEHLPRDKLDEILAQGQEVKKLLIEMQDLLKKYERLNAQSKLTFDRLRWDNKAAESIRHRLNAMVNVLNSMYLAILASGQFRLQKAMDRLVRDIQSGRKDIASVSSISVDETLNTAAWRSIINDLHMLGISDDVVKEHNALIIERIASVVNEQAQIDQAHEQASEQQTSLNQHTPQGSSENQHTGLELVPFGEANVNPEPPSGEASSRASIATPRDSILDVSANELAGGTLLTKFDYLVLLWDKYPNDEITLSITDILKSEKLLLKQRSRILLILLRGINESLLGHPENAIDDFRDIFIPAASRLGLMPDIEDLSDRYILISAALWYSNTSLQLGFVSDSVLVPVWAFSAAENGAHISHTMSVQRMFRDMREVSEVENLENMSGEENGLDIHRNGMSPQLSQVFEQWAKQDFESFGKKLKQYDEKRLEFFNSRPLTWDQKISRELLMDAHHIHFQSWAWRYDRFFWSKGTMYDLVDALPPDRNESFPGLEELSTVGWWKFRYLDFTTTKELGRVLKQAEVRSRQCALKVHVKGAYVIFKFLDEHLVGPKRSSTEDSYPTLSSPCTIHAKLVRQTLPLLSSRAWGIEFIEGQDKQFKLVHACRQPQKWMVSELEEFEDNLKKRAIEQFRTAVETLEKGGADE